MKKIVVGLLAIGVSLLAAIAGFADSITVDENGGGLINSTAIVGTLQRDPGPGGLPSVLTYPLTFAGTQGDVGLSSSNEGSPVPMTLDYIRFNGNGTVLFYSDNLPTADSLGDTIGPPGTLYANRVTIPEVGPEGNNGAFYTPLPGQPGYDPSGPTYHFISDGATSVVPEPGTFALMLLGAGLLSVMCYGRRHLRKRA